MEMKILGRHVIRATKRNERAELITYGCKLQGECPLLAKGQCAAMGLLARCVYGVRMKDTTVTKAAGAYRAQYAEFEERTKDCPPPNAVPANEMRMAYIGEYVWLPYAHMNHFDGKDAGIPFLSHSTIFSSGSEFMKREEFTVDVILRIIRLRPMALMGGEITDYRLRSLPKFLADLETMDPELYAEVAKREPSICNMAAVAQPVWVPFKDLPKDARKIQIAGMGDDPFTFYACTGRVEGMIPNPGLPTETERIQVHFIPTPETLVCPLDRDIQIKLNRQDAA